MMKSESKSTIYQQFFEWVQENGQLIERHKTDVQINGWKKAGKHAAYLVTDPFNEQFQYFVTLDTAPWYDDSRVVSVFRRVGKDKPPEPVYFSRYVMRTYRDSPLKTVYGELTKDLSDPGILRSFLDRWEEEQG